jgi:hypothetical protein
MPTATKPKATKARAKAARKPAATKAKASRARASARKATQSKTTRAKASRTRALHQSESAARQAQTATRDTAQVLGDYAERVVLIPVGATLIARDRVVSSVSDTFSTYSSKSKTEAQLRRFERRGLTARKRLEREVRKTRVRVERDLRQRRRRIESTVTDIEKRSETFAKNGSDLANRIPELVEGAQERILSLV